METADFLGQTRAGYVFEALLDSGPRGAVYRAAEVTSGRTVAVRVLPPGLPPDKARPMLEQIQALARLGSPHILSIYKIFKSAGRFCVAMRYAERGNLRRLLDTGPLPEATAAAIAHQAALGLDHAASVGVLHRDLRPESFLMTADDRLLLGGFAVAPERAISSRRTVVGTPLYMAPECCMQSGSHSLRSDLYALGCVLFEMLSGAPPYDDPSQANLLVKHLMDPVPALGTGVSPDLRRLVERLLQKEPDARPASGAELAGALAPHASSELVGDSISSLSQITEARNEQLARAPREIVLPDSEAALAAEGIALGPVIEISMSGPSPDPSEMTPRQNLVDRAPRPRPEGPIEIHDSDVSLELDSAARLDALEQPTLPEPEEADEENDAAPPPRPRIKAPRRRSSGRLSPLPALPARRPPGLPFWAWPSIAGGVVLLVILAVLATRDGSPRAPEGTDGPQEVVEAPPPAFEIFAPDAGAWIEEIPFEVRVRALNFAAEEVSVQGIDARRSSANVWVARLELADGEDLRLYATARDTSGLVLHDTIRVSVDTRPPEIVILQPLDGAAVRTESVAVEVRVEGAQTVTIQGREVEPEDGLYRRTVALIQGEQVVRVGAIDRFRRRADAEVAITVDGRAPRLGFDTPVFAGTEVLVTLESNEPLERYTVDGVAFDGDGRRDIPLRFSLAGGASEHAVTASDRAGNEATRTFSLSEDELIEAYNALFDEGFEAYAEGRLTRAIEAFEGCTAIFPDEAVPYINLASLHCDRGDGERGLALLREALERGERDLAWIEGNQAFDLIRDSVGFQELMAEFFGADAPLRGLTLVEPWWNPTAAQKEAAAQLDLPVAAVNTSGMRFALVPAGSFRAGSPEDEPGRRDDELQRDVELTRAFYIAAEEVGQRDWEALMDDNPSRFSGSGHPVETVGWEEAARFCNALSAQDGLAPAYALDGEEVRFLGLDSEGWRLPTEAEWEYACRAGTTTPWAFGRSLRGTMARFDDPVDGGSFRAGTTPRGRFAPNTWGLYDMHGNVFEWCQDWYDPSPRDGRDPVGPASGERRVLRGGCWSSFAEDCRAAARSFPDLGGAFGYRGVRVVRSVPGR